MPSLRTVESWAKIHTWLRFNVEDGNVDDMHCFICRQHASQIKYCRNYSPKFVDGVAGSALKKDNVDKHARSEAHKKAVNLEKNPTTLLEIYKTTPIGRAFSHASASETDRVGRLIDISYLLAKIELPFSKFSDLVFMEKKHGVQLGETYINEKGCKDFTAIIGELLEEDFVKDINKASYISVLMDGSTDSSVVEKELLYTIFLDESGAVSVKFAKMKDVKSGTAEGLKETLTQAFADLGIGNLKEKRVCIGVDGAAVNTGCKNGLGALLKKDGIDWLVVVHCLNHRLELAMKDAFHNTFIEDIITMLMNLYYLYQKSPKRLRDLKELAEIMDEQVLKPEKAHGTRWLQHKVKACEASARSYNPIITHLETLAATEKTAEQAKLKGYLKTLKSVNFVTQLLFFQQLLRPLANISQCLQAEKTDILLASTLLETVHTKLEELKTKNSAELKVILETIEAGQKPTYKTVYLEGKSNLGSNRVKYIDKVMSCLKNRFSDLQSLDIFKAMKILDVRLWPDSKEDLDSFGNKELQEIVTHFSNLLVSNRVDLDLIYDEWATFKQFWHQNLKADKHSREVVWATFFRLKQNYPNLSHIITILRIYPVSNATVERGFSTMRRIKTDWRNRLNESSLDMLMRISIEGPTLAEFDNSGAVKKFFSTPRRTSVAPYGKRKSQSVPESATAGYEGTDSDTQTMSDSEIAGPSGDIRVMSEIAGPSGDTRAMPEIAGPSGVKKTKTVIEIDTGSEDSD